MLPRRFYFDHALDDFFEEEGAKMKCDIYEKDNIYHVDMDLPGFTKEEIKNIYVAKEFMENIQEVFILEM